MFTAMTGLAVSAGCLLSSNSASNDIELSAIQLKNVEALGNIELEPGQYEVIFEAVDKMVCNPGGKVKCPIAEFLP